MTYAGASDPDRRPVSAAAGSPPGLPPRVKDRSRTYTLSRACDVVEPLLALFAASCPSLEQLTAAGGLRRFEPIVDDLTIVGCARDPEAAIDAIAAIPELEGVRSRTKRRLIVTYRNVEVAVRVAAPDEFGTMLHSATGSREHLNAVGARRSARTAVLARGGRLRRRRAAVDSTGDPPRHGRGRGCGLSIAADARRVAADTRRSAHALDVQRWPGLDRSHGRGIERPRLRVHRNYRSLGARRRRTDPVARRPGASTRRDRAAARTVPVDRHPSRHRSGHHARRRARFPGLRPRDARHRARFAARRRGPRRTGADAPLSRRDQASARVDHLASWQPHRRTPRTLPDGLQCHLPGRGRNRARRSRSTARRCTSTSTASTRARQLPQV